MVDVEFEPQPLVCEECGAVADERAAGWRAYLTLEPDGGELAAVFCPPCAETEFGD